MGVIFYHYYYKADGVMEAYVRVGNESVLCAGLRKKSVDFEP